MSLRIPIHRDEVILSYEDGDCFVVPPRNDDATLFFLKSNQKSIQYPLVQVLLPDEIVLT